MNLLLIGWRLLRYRVAVMLLLFMFLAVAFHNGFHDKAAWQLVCAGLALAASYMSATSLNDLADYAIDRINHKNSPGRPLITGMAQRRDLWMVFAVASTLAITAAGLVTIMAAAVMAVSVAINVLYSLPPLRLSYRTFLAPLVLGVAYVGIPYMLGLVILGLLPTGNDWLWMAGLYALFVGRIILKDFRDRKGDAKYGKPTFLLRYGKNATCIVSLIGLVAGTGFILWQVRNATWLVAYVTLYAAAIISLLWRLQQAPQGAAEQLSIGVGAKLGNGLLITLLTAYVLAGSGASATVTIAACGMVTGLFLLNYCLFLLQPERAVIGYKG